MSRRNIILIAAVLFALLVGFRIISSRKGAKAVEADSGKPVYVQKVTRGVMQTTLKISGNILASQQAEIYSRVPGKLISNLAEEGDYVRDGQEIALIDRDEIGVSFSTAIVKSTINGVLLKHYMDPGAKVSPMAPVATVGNIRKVKAVINLPENDFVKIKRGTNAYISVDAYPGRKFPGEVSLVSPEIDLMSRTGKVEILIDNREQALKPGMFGQVDILLAHHSGVIVIPRSAVIEDGDVKKAFLYDNGKTKERVLATGLYDDDNIEVIKGLEAGETLIIEGQHKLKNDDAVRIVEE